MLRRAGTRQALHLLHLGLIVGAAWAAAGVAVRVASLDLSPAPPRTTAATEDAARPASRRGADDAAILRRNLFGVADLEVEGEDEAPVAVGGGELRLRGLAARAGTSFAVFENSTSGDQDVFAVGEKVFDGPRLVSVDATGAEVMLKGRRKRYELEDDAPAASPREARPAAEGKTAKPGKDAKAGRAGDGVRKTGAGMFLVDRREIETAVANLNEVITQARAVPVSADGKAAGFKVFQIRRGSIFDRIGLADGDIVQKVNDTELTDPSKAVGLLEEIQSMSQIRVHFVRGGKLHTNTYTVQ